MRGVIIDIRTEVYINKYLRFIYERRDARRCVRESGRAAYSKSELQMTKTGTGRSASPVIKRLNVKGKD